MTSVCPVNLMHCGFRLMQCVRECSSFEALRDLLLQPFLYHVTIQRPSRGPKTATLEKRHSPFKLLPDGPVLAVN